MILVYLGAVGFSEFLMWEPSVLCVYAPVEIDWISIHIQKDLLSVQ